MKRATIVIALVIGAISITGFAACSGETGATAADKPTETTTSTTEVDQAQEIADQIAEWSPKQYSSLCAQYGQTPAMQSMMERQGIKILGPQIIKMGGQPAEVVEVMFEDCG